GVGAPGAGEHYGLVGNEGQGRFHLGLDAGTVTLPLPATKRPAVVLHRRGDAVYTVRQGLPRQQQAVGQIPPFLSSQNNGLPGSWEPEPAALSRSGPAVGELFPSA